MLLETGRVVAVEDDSVWVETIRRTTCGTCAAKSGCGHGVMNRISEGHRSLIRALPGKIHPQQCAVDDEVQISIPEEVILRGSVVVYIVPVVSMLALAAAGAALGGDAGSAIGALAGLAAGVGLVRLHANRHRQDDSFQPVLEDILSPSAQAVSLD
ncbi:transcriptional regulator [Halioglobus maricola]|uniref:Transcriptional regulator n=1 Tax=Halioglobus maricola TaxID=2601894 RepID=A0A5P9NNN2_9GAMM|nr:SoxR reducing system RseC family protein [Halioglobus maricola]QFU76518.1 transcriptional regulator [Halioglobus maricola]